jgi:hypothetical protein
LPCSFMPQFSSWGAQGLSGDVSQSINQKKKT